MGIEASHPLSVDVHANKTSLHRKRTQEGCKYDKGKFA